MSTLPIRMIVNNSLKNKVVYQNHLLLSWGSARFTQSNRQRHLLARTYVQVQVVSHPAEQIYNLKGHVSFFIPEDHTFHFVSPYDPGTKAPHGKRKATTKATKNFARCHSNFCSKC